MQPEAVVTMAGIWARSWVVVALAVQPPKKRRLVAVVVTRLVVAGRLGGEQIKKWLVAVVGARVVVAVVGTRVVVATRLGGEQKEKWLVAVVRGPRVVASLAVEPTKTRLVALVVAGLGGAQIEKRVVPVVGARVVEPAKTRGVVPVDP